MVVILLVLGLVVFAVLLYVVYLLVRLARADADLNLLNHSLNPGYFKGKVVWVTGASSGIGEELCKQLSKLGAKLILSARSKDKLEEVAKGLAHPENSKVLVLDLADQSSVNEAAEKAVKLFGRIDILVNNGGMSSRSYFLDFQEESARQLMEVNFFGTVSLTRNTIRVMIEQESKGGQIVNISSVLGKYSTIRRHYYSASKFALIGLMDSLRLEFLNEGISITNICPGLTRTNVCVNALTGDGTKFGKNDAAMAKGMAVERCVELTLVAVCNQIREVWISQYPKVFEVYFSQYLPSLSFHRLRNQVIATQKAASQASKKD